MGFWFVPIVCLGLASATFAVGSEADSIRTRHRNLLLECWKTRVDRNGGMHEWSSTHAGMRVFQEWAALLTLARDSGIAVRRKWGRALERYVVEGKIRPFGRPGTDLPIPGTEHGDFDMVALNAVTLLKLFEDDRLLLTDNTYAHLVLELVRPSVDVPATFDVAFLRFPETENHLFMMESNRFLVLEIAEQNSRRLPSIRAWKETMASKGTTLPGRQRAFLLQAMQNVMRKGFFESNAKVYQRFTAQALTNLYSFAQDSAVATGAGCVLDYLSALFATQSIGSVRFGPYRRSAEAFQDPALVDRDPLCSFFAVQSGQYPWDPDPHDGFWQAHTSHASTALFSLLLRYRVPEPILDWMRRKPGEYEAEIRSGYAAKFREPVERYAGGPNWLLSAGGRYAPPPGPNFPTLRHWPKRGPWVYDLIARPASLIFFSAQRSLVVESDIIHTRTGWDGDQLALQGPFLYAHAPAISGDENSWPFHIPPGECPDSSVAETPRFLFRFCEPVGQEVYLVFSKIRPKAWKWPWQQAHVRGGLEVVSKNQVPTMTRLQKLVLDANREKGHGTSIPYTTVDGKRFWLNTSYAPGKLGILHRPHENWNGLMRAWQLGDGREIAYVDGRGALRFRNPVTGETVTGDFREWWRPLRFTIPTINSLQNSGK